MKYSYHYYAEYMKYSEKYNHYINSVIQVPFKVVDGETYNKLKEAIIENYYLGMHIDTLRLIITSLTLLHTEED